MTVPFAPIPVPAAGLLRFRPSNQPTIGSDLLSHGMTMWFHVKVRAPGLVDLGRWSACTGLNVELGTEAAPGDLRHDQPAVLPTVLKYGDITLRRAVTHADHDNISGWLETVVADWVLAPEGATPAEDEKSPRGYAGATVLIELYSALRPSDDGVGGLGGTQAPVATWELRNAYPVRWTGPSLDASAGQVAREELTLRHSGFLHLGGKPPEAGGTTTPGASAAANGQKRVSLVLAKDKSDPTKKLVLQFQPSTISMTKEIRFAEGNASKTDITDPGRVSYSFTAQAEGVTAVEDAREKLFGWLVSATKTGQQTNEQEDLVAKTLDLTIGRGTGRIESQVWLKGVSARVTRFSPDGDPARATFDLSLQEVDPVTPTPTNPTSVGPPGRAVHTVVQGDALARVAHAAYGSPGRWRDIAQANAIDDPLRLRTGRVLTVPGTGA